MIAGSAKAGVPVDLLLPTKTLINRVIEEEDCVFQEGSLSMDNYLEEFHSGLLRIKELISSSE
jgi:hypothetical protein